MSACGVNDSNHKAVDAEQPVQVMQNEKVKLHWWRKVLGSILLMP